MLSSLVIAILTDSALIIRWKEIDKYIEEPVYKAFYDFSNQSNEFNANFRSEDIYRPSANASWQKNKDMNQLIKTLIPLNKTRIAYNSIEPLFFEICSNPAYYDKVN